MRSDKVTFKNKNGYLLNGVVEVPTSKEPHNFVLFAHCFTCNKNYFAVKNISQALTSRGYGVLRFDFTGLGESEGEFGDSNFSGNVDDLILAAEFLKENYQSPTLLVGHSLGGSAVLFAAKKIESVKAVATIAAPFHVSHVKHLLKEQLKEIEEEGMKEVHIGGRPFFIQKQFLEDLENSKLEEVLPSLNKALLIMHSPQDDIVEIKNAEEIYIAARHPKSFISLEGANHLLSNKEDSIYAGHVISTWAEKYVHIPMPEPIDSKHDVVAELGREGFTTQIKAGNHYLTSDEPLKVGGEDLGPSPYELVSAGLAACTVMTIQIYARRKEWIIDEVECHVSYSKDHLKDCETCEDDAAKIDTFTRELKIQGDLTEKQLDKLMQIADKCPVHKTLHTQTQIITTLISE